jgi:CRP-like cAMP-binding protein
MYERFFASLREKVELSGDAEAAIAAVIQPKQVQRRQQLLREGDVSTRLSFVDSGAIYSYTLDAKGAQHVIQFAFPGWWIGDLYSLFTAEPGRLYLEALADSELLQIRIEDHNLLLDTVPVYERYMRILIQNAYVALQRRLGGTLGLSAEQRYAALLYQNPEILNQVPQHLIASFLGVTPETLSRIRRQLSR